MNHAHFKTINGIQNLIVDGKPFIINGAQCDIWRSTRQDKKTIEFFDAYERMNATAVSMGVPWSKIEVREDEYDFSFMDWFIQHAEKRGLKLVIHLFDINICGKVHEMTDGEIYPLYTPQYILDHPETYQRIKFNVDNQYVAGGPPMCPNNKNLLERELKYVCKVAEHLKETDTNRTVIALQINNEYYYQQWEGERPKDLKAVRCTCPNCEAKYQKDSYETAEEFMFRSFAEYTRELTDAISVIYDLPLYVNSPWWEPYIVPIFLDTCPNLDFVGIDGVFTPFEPNWLSINQEGRNIAFAAESPTESPYTKPNLSVLPYYVIIKQNGIGDLLWECFEPHTVTYDEDASTRYAAALYPIKHALVPIAETRGSEQFNGWYNIQEELKIVEEMDIFGNTQKLKNPKYISRGGFVIRQGNDIIDAENKDLLITCMGYNFGISDDSKAGFIMNIAPKTFIIASSGVTLTVDAKAIELEEGVYNGEVWEGKKAYHYESTGKAVIIAMHEPNVLKLTIKD